MKIRRTHPLSAGIARALRMAVLLPTEDHVRLRVQVVSARGETLAEGHLDGFDQAVFLRDQLRPLGFFEYLPTAVGQADQHDLVLREQDGTDPAVADGLVRQGDSTSWPPGARLQPPAGRLAP